MDLCRNIFLATNQEERNETINMQTWMMTDSSVMVLSQAKVEDWESEKLKI